MRGFRVAPSLGDPPRRSHRVPVYHALAVAAGHDYWFVICDSAGDSEIRVEVGELLATLDAALEAPPDISCVSLGD